MSNSVTVGAAFKYNDSSNRGPDEDESFTVVTSRRKRRQQEKRRGGPLITPAEALKRTLDTLRADKEWLAQCSSIVRNAVAALPSPITRILCLGLGSPTELTEARFQLAFLLELRDIILPSVVLNGNSRSNSREGEDSETGAPNPIEVYAYDPVFSSADTALLACLGIHVIPEEEVETGTHLTLHDANFDHGATSTLAFMPHCDWQLYEQILMTNWAPAPLSRLVLIGNVLHQYPANPPPPMYPPRDAPKTANESPKASLSQTCISRLAPLMACTVLPELDACPRAFSSTAVQRITAASIPVLEERDKGGQVQGEGEGGSSIRDDPVARRLPKTETRNTLPAANKKAKTGLRSVSEFDKSASK